MPCDYSKYPPNWKTEIVPKILKRAKNCCEVCGLKNGQNVFSVKLYLKSAKYGRYGYYQVWFRDLMDAVKVGRHAYETKTVKVILTVAHLDHDPENHKVLQRRLKAMCQSCHFAYDHEERMKKRTGNEYQKEFKGDWG